MDSYEPAAAEVPEEERPQVQPDVVDEELPDDADPADAFEQRLPGADSEIQPLAEEPIGERLEAADEADVLEQSLDVPTEEERT
jgi:hypothetical protein